MPNLEAHIEHMKAFGVPVVVAVNTFPTDTPAEHYMIKKRALAAGADFAVSHDMHAEGGEGGVELAEAVVEACEMPKDFRLLYPDDATIKQKIEAVAMRIYGADGVDYCAEAEEKIELYTRLGYDRCRSAWPRRSSRSRTTRRSRADRRGGGCPCATCGRASVRASCIRCAPTSARCRGFPRTPAGDNIDLDDEGTSRRPALAAVARAPRAGGAARPRRAPLASSANQCSPKSPSAIRSIGSFK